MSQNEQDGDGLPTFRRSPRGMLNGTEDKIIEKARDDASEPGLDPVKDSVIPAQHCSHGSHGSHGSW